MKTRTNWKLFAQLHNMKCNCTCLPLQFHNPENSNYEPIHNTYIKPVPQDHKKKARKILPFQESHQDTSTDDKHFADEPDDYDDVGPPSLAASPPQEPPPPIPADDEQVYDDVGPPAVQPQINHQHQEEPVAETPLPVDEDVYDDVGPLQRPKDGQDCHERVNSLYAGSSASGCIQLALSTYDKESEWEDLEDAGIYQLNEG